MTEIRMPRLSALSATTIMDAVVTTPIKIRELREREHVQMCYYGVCIGELLWPLRAYEFCIREFLWE